MENTQIVRLSPRGYRDLRITTHCCLVARAFGAQKMVLESENDPKIKETMNTITHKFGGNFEVEFVENPIHLIRKLKKKGWTIVHLTMYGEPAMDPLPAIRKKKKMVVIIGSEKVPPEVYQLADYNISITNQPHSEVAALAIFLFLMSGKEILQKKFENAKIHIEPQKKGKRVTHLV